MPDKSDTAKPNTRVFLVLLSAIFLLAGYYLVHKPFTPGTGLAMGMTLWRIALGLLILTLAGMTGRSLGLRLEGRPLSTVVLQTGLGLGLLATMVLLLGSILGVNWITLGLLPAVAIILLRKHALEWWRELTASFADVWIQTGRFEKWIATIIAVSLVFSLGIALAPPIKYDALMYHLVMPQTYIQQGRITHIPWLVMSGMPQCTEMLFTLAMFWGGQAAAAVLGWLIGLLALLGMIGFFQDGQADHGRIGWVAAAALMAGETFAVSLAWAYIDWTGLLFGICCFTALHAWMKVDRIYSVLTAGLFAGLAFTTKYTGGVLILCALVVVVVQIGHYSKDCQPGKWRTLSAFLAGAAAFPLAWLARNLILTGNPVYPFFFPAAEMDAVRLSVYQGAVPYGEWWEGLLIPLRATLWGQESAEGYSVSIGVLFLLLGLGNLLRSRPVEEDHRLTLRLGVTVFLSGWFIWAVGNRLSGFLIQTRMYYSLFPAFALLAGLGWSALRVIHWRGVRFERLFGAVILMALGLTSFGTALQALKQDAPRASAGLINETAYQDANLGWYGPAIRAVKDLPIGSRTLFLYEPRGLACVPACDPDEILDQWKISRMENASNESVLNLWKQKGYNYLLVNKAGMDFLADGKDAHHPAAEIQALRDLLETLPPPRSFGNSYQIYTIP